MKIGKLYKNNGLFWWLFPSKEIAVANAAAETAGSQVASDPTVRLAVDYGSKKLNCNGSYISPNSIFVLLDQDEKFIKVLTTNGELGWFYLSDWCKDDIKEVKV
jgi:hypothetical protein